MKTQIKNKLASPNQKDSSTTYSSNIISTPCEKVLCILNEAKNFILSHSKSQNTLISSLDWAIEVITSRSLYSYEFKEKEKVKKLSEENPEFKELVDFVTEYNEKVIKMNRKYNYILTDKLLQKPSINLNKKKLKRKSSFIKHSSKLANIFDLAEAENNENVDNVISYTEQKNINNNIVENISEYSYKKQNSNSIISSNNKSDKKNNNIKKQLNNKKKNKQIININDETEENDSNQGIEFLKGYFKSKVSDIKNEIRKKSHDKKPKSNKFIFFPSVQKISITINNNNERQTKHNNNLSNDLTSLEQIKLSLI